MWLYLNAVSGIKSWMGIGHYLELCTRWQAVAAQIFRRFIQWFLQNSKLIKIENENQLILMEKSLASA